MYVSVLLMYGRTFCLLEPSVPVASATTTNRTAPDYTIRNAYFQLVHIIVPLNAIIITDIVGTPLSYLRRLGQCYIAIALFSDTLIVTAG